MIVTDSIQLPDDKKISKIKQISTAPLISDAIVRIDQNRPISPLFNSRFDYETDQIKPDKQK